MYHHCLFCSADLGVNDVLEVFPVGRTVAFDTGQGRLWAVCRHCSRWNLAPIEERWEVLEAAERRFRDTRLRVHSENIGLCRTPDGTRLVRIGAALPGELAAFRYGRELARRRRRGALWVAGAAVSITAGFMGPWIGVGLALALQQGFGAAALVWRRKSMYAVRADESPHGAAGTLRRSHLDKFVVGRDEAGRLRVELRPVSFFDESIGPSRRPPPPLFSFHGDRAIGLLRRATVLLNGGARPGQLDEAVLRLSAAGSPTAFLDTVADRRVRFGGVPCDYRYEPDGELADVADGLALEMALNEEQERRALEGELALLRSAWQEADEIARIADSLLLPRRTPGA